MDPARLVSQVRYGSLSMLEPALTGSGHSLRNTKPSAIFRLRGSAVPSAGGSAASFASAIQQNGVTATLGISIEPDDAVDAQMATLPPAAPATDPNKAVDSALALAPKIGTLPPPLALRCFAAAETRH